MTCAIVLEGTTANDLGDVPEHLRVCAPGKGVAISMMDNSSLSHEPLWRALRALARKEDIPWQMKSYVSGGNDAGRLQRERGAVATAVLNVPCRYIHSPSSVASPCGSAPVSASRLVIVIVPVWGLFGTVTDSYTTSMV